LPISRFALAAGCEYDSPMADPFLLIDGYNLMHAVGLSRSSDGPGEFERRRNRFLRYLAACLTDRERERTTIVFDAPTSRRKCLLRTSSCGMQVVFSHARLEADDVLEELIAQHSAPRQILLISSDHRLQKAVRKRRGQHVDSEDFAEELEHRSQRGEPSPRNAPSHEMTLKCAGLHSPDERRFWLNYFDDVPENLDVPERPNAVPPSGDRPDANQVMDDHASLDVDALQRDIDRMTRRSGSGGAP